MTVRIEGAPSFETVPELKGGIDRGWMERTAVISCYADWKQVDRRVGTLVIQDGCCNEENFRVLDVSEFVNLKELRVGDDCLKNVNELRVVGLKQLETVAIGANSCTQEKHCWSGNPHRHFSLRNCPNVKTLKSGNGSFIDYTECRIEDYPSLEVIEMGNLKYEEGCDSFLDASFELRSNRCVGLS